VKNFSKIISVAIAFSLIFVLAGCDESTIEEAKPSPNLDALQNDLQDGSYSQEVTLDNVSFKTTYTTDYDAKNWKITSPKTLTSEISITQIPAGTRVQIIHIHVDTSLLSTQEQVQGLSIDNMDDKLSSGTESGIDVTKDYPYTLIFSIEGFSKDLISGWGFITGSYGCISLSQNRLTESNLTDPKYGAGVYGQKFTYIYKFLIKNESDAGWHEVTFSDEFYVPVVHTATNQ